MKMSSNEEKEEEKPKKKTKLWSDPEVEVEF